jgi:glycosyltransferase involved in cell wall biosynthesis
MVCHSRAPFPFRHFILAWKYLQIRQEVSAVWITEGGHRLVPFARLITACTGKKLIFDPFLSRYNTRIEDRRLYRKAGLQALICLWQDWSSTHAADFLVFDTMVHKQYFYRKYALKKPFAVLPVGVEETYFTPTTAVSDNSSEFTVLFFGTYIPLQGIEYIIEAAHVLRDVKGIRFILIGEGQTYTAIREKAGSLRLSNLIMRPSIPEQQLPAEISRAHVVLGIFGTTVKANQVVPNKVVQSAAMGKAVITGRTEAVQMYFKDNQDIMLVTPGDGNDLAGKIRFLKEHAGMREALGKNARRKFDMTFSKKALSGIMSDILNLNTQ